MDAYSFVSRWSHLEISTAITASLHQAMKFIDNVSLYVARWFDPHYYS